MAGTLVLTKAKNEKNDEFYTQLSDIENELSHYINQFKNKIIYCNCDNPYKSNFVRYFIQHFNEYGIKELIATCYDPECITSNLFKDKFTHKSTAYHLEIFNVPDDISDIESVFSYKNNKLSTLKSNGDFQSKECIEILKSSDIIVTNPPFSLFRKYIQQLIEYDKKFIIIGNQNVIACKEFFPLLKKNQVWIGYGFPGNVGFFESPYEDKAVSSQHKKGMIRVFGVIWFTNLDIKKRHEKMILVKRYNPELYPKYDNYDAIEVSKTQDIPCDYDDIMGVPDTFMDKYNPDQFEILGSTQRGCHDEIPELKQYDEYWEMRQDGTKTGSNGSKTNGNANLIKNDGKHNYFINNKGEIVQSVYNRIFIRNKYPE